jgi:hypothetical protein
LKDGQSTTSLALAVVPTVGKPAKGISPGLSVNLGASAVALLAVAVGAAVFPLTLLLLLATFASFVPQATEDSNKQKAKSRGDFFISFLFD